MGALRRLGRVRPWVKASAGWARLLRVKDGAGKETQEPSFSAARPSPHLRRECAVLPIIATGKAGMLAIKRD